MSIENKFQIDAMAIGEENKLVLLLSDGLDWTNEIGHLLMLQDKINMYISFCENEEYKKTYPGFSFDAAKFEIHFVFEPTENALKFLANVQVKLAREGISLECFVD